ncbi:hypothetical protein [Cellulosimicrobium cellulans]|uniref:Uncharacterized protein n=1 Tax=Cellulosimicrobium cellulans TaxID=1710 RepID=A0A4Y4DXX0_CELCE|nr:hypothetical protein [Cellulosimicrobium cellulans]GED08270.1 hypothetical protein CCE02nite_02690 [Cellulosimicrobium cellulans]
MTTRIVEQLALQSSGDGNDVRVAEGGALLHRWDGMSYDPPIVLDVADDDLNRFLDAVADDGEVLWPGRDTQWAGCALLITHIDEVLRTSETSPVRLRIDGEGRLRAD